jgi:hypothetical protein
LDAPGRASFRAATFPHREHGAVSPGLQKFPPFEQVCFLNRGDLNSKHSQLNDTRRRSSEDIRACGTSNSDSFHTARARDSVSNISQKSLRNGKLVLETVTAGPSTAFNTTRTRASDLSSSSDTSAKETIRGIVNRSHNTMSEQPLLQSAPGTILLSSQHMPY